MPSLNEAARLTDDVIDGGIMQLMNEAAFLLSQIHELKHLQQQAASSPTGDGVEVKTSGGDDEDDSEKGGEGGSASSSTAGGGEERHTMTTSGADLHAEIVRVQKVHGELVLAIEGLREKYRACREKLTELSRFYGDEGGPSAAARKPPRPKAKSGGGSGGIEEFETGLLSQAPFETLSTIVKVFKQTLTEIESNPRKFSVVLVAQELRHATLAERSRFLKERIEGVAIQPYRKSTPSTKPLPGINTETAEQQQFRKAPTFTPPKRSTAVRRSNTTAPSSSQHRKGLHAPPPGFPSKKATAVDGEGVAGVVLPPLPTPASPRADGSGGAEAHSASSSSSSSSSQRPSLPPPSNPSLSPLDALQPAFSNMALAASINKALFAGEKGEVVIRKTSSAEHDAKAGAGEGGGSQKGSSTDKEGGGGPSAVRGGADEKDGSKTRAAAAEGEERGEGEESKELNVLEVRVLPSAPVFTWQGEGSTKTAFQAKRQIFSKQKPILLKPRRPPPPYVKKPVANDKESQE